jgi:hypothetical protein
MAALQESAADAESAVFFSLYPKTRPGVRSLCERGDLPAVNRLERFRTAARTIGNPHGSQR